MALFLDRLHEKILLDLSKKDPIESNYHHMKVISCKKESIKCAIAISTPGKPCICDSMR